MKKNIYKIIFTACIVFSLFSLQAQQVNTQYFLENVPTRHFLNPAFQPTSNVYVSLPVIGYTQFGIMNNSLTLRDVIYKDASGNPILFLNPNGGDKNKFYNALRGNTMIRADVQTNILGFGFRTGRSYWTFGVSAKVDGQLSVPKDFFSLALFGTGRPDANGNGNKFNLKHLGADATAYLEAALGYSREIDEQWNFGVKLKFLYGLFNVSATNSYLDLYTGMDQWKLDGYGELNISAPMTTDVVDGELVFGDMPEIQELVKPAGLGGAIDLGVTYKPIEALTLSAAITDLGFINWTKNARNMSYRVNYKFDGLYDFNNDTEFDNLAPIGELADSIFSAIEKSFEPNTEGTEAYNTILSPKLNIGAEYGFWDQKLNIGLLSRTTLHKGRVYEELTASLSTRPANWFNFGVSYSILNGRFSNIGAGLGLRSGIINWHLSADYVPLTYAGLPINDSFKAPIPYNTKGLNLALGVNFVFGNKRDKDKDGVPDKYDLCPETPRKVKVDQNGCPLDTDGDSIPDYLDLCPDTPIEARGYVDEHGCPLDTDGDGIPDYLDKCPDTPEAAYGQIDEHGCPLDSDGDGVPDYLDKCPDTPAEAKGMVDEHGCLLDSDGDGIPDYLDKCPDTPAEAYDTIDEFGCPKDTDGDGVPDYLDKCPDTPKEAYRFIDEHGCPLDTDGDGVPDYLDHCPKTPGTKENNGCPEVKKEVRSLFQKAMQGIQFETGKSIIRKNSYGILDQIAQVMLDNPTYLLEIQGHTDNVGKKEANQKLSEDRAASVRDYLIKKGVKPERMTSAGYGDTLPVSTNSTATGRALNRRVEFVVSFEEVRFE